MYSEWPPEDQPRSAGGGVRRGILELKWTQGTAPETKKEAFLECAKLVPSRLSDCLLPVLGSSPFPRVLSLLESSMC